MVWGGTATLQISIEGMVLYVIETEFVERLTKVEERSKSNTHQINDLKPVIEEIHTMSKTMVELIGEVKHTNENVSELKDKVDILEKEPGKQWTATKRTFFTATVGTAAVMGEVNWPMVASASVLAGILSMATSIAGLPELDTKTGA